MPRKCIVPACLIQQDDDGCNQLGFRRFSKNEPLRQIWIRALTDQFGYNTVDQIMKPKNLFVCDLHFIECCFYLSGMEQKLMLKKESSPSIFINCRSTALKAIIDKYEKIQHFIENKTANLEPQNFVHKNTDCSQLKQEAQELNDFSALNEDLYNAFKIYQDSNGIFSK